MDHQASDGGIKPTSIGFTRVRLKKVSRTEMGDEKVKYRVHRVDLNITKDQGKLELFLNGLKGEVVTIIPNVTLGVTAPHVDFLLVVERI